tara:strand:- start:440 stop:613 length:174 start_codon:yes stop_codon:yes gene_type:complete
MTTKQLRKLAKKYGWIFTRSGGNHLIYRRGSDQLTIPLATRGFVGHQIKKQITRSAA